LLPRVPVNLPFNLRLEEVLLRDTVSSVTQPGMQIRIRLHQCNIIINLLVLFHLQSRHISSKSAQAG
jgi:hypothetical protein